MQTADAVPWRHLAGVALVVVALVADVVLGAFALLRVPGGAGGDPLLVALVGTAVPCLLVGFVLVAVGVALLVVALAAFPKAADLPDSEWVRSVADRIERRAGLLSWFGVERPPRPGVPGALMLSAASPTR